MSSCAVAPASEPPWCGPRCVEALGDCATATAINCWSWHPEHDPRTPASEGLERSLDIGGEIKALMSHLGGGWWISCGGHGHFLTERRSTLSSRVRKEELGYQAPAKPAIPVPPQRAEVESRTGAQVPLSGTFAFGQPIANDGCHDPLADPLVKVRCMDELEEVEAVPLNACFRCFAV